MRIPEELTEDWKAGKLPQWKFYYIAYSGGVEPLLLNGENDFNNHCRIINSLVKKILAPVPTYDEYKAMQAELDEFKCAITSYIGKPIDYDIACETVNKLLDDKEKLKKKLAEYRIDKAKLEEENKIWSELAENLLCLEEEKWENLVKNGTKEQRLDFLRHKEKYSLLAVLDKYVQLRGLLNECKEFFEEENPKDFTIMSERMEDLLARIKDALGESEA